MQRFSLRLTLLDAMGEPLTIGVGLSEDTIRISSRSVSEAKLGLYGPMSALVTLLKTREMRKDLFIEAARLLGARMAERMEDAEGWHDQSRIEPAREQLGGRWEP